MHPLATPKVSTAPLYFTFHGGSIEFEKVTRFVHLNFVQLNSTTRPRKRDVFVDV